MIYRIKLPRLGETMEEGLIAEWHKKVGDQVNKGDALYSVETDKTVVEVQSVWAGRLREIRVPAGQTISVGDVVAILEA